MKARTTGIGGMLLLLALVAIGYYLGIPIGTGSAERAAPSTDIALPDVTTRAPAESPSPVAPPPADGVRRIVDHAEIKNYGDVIHRGPVDLTATIERIRAGVKHPHRNDGSVFGNRERLLPGKPRGYYREYVHPTEGLNGPGPQRIVVGRDGDWWYTPDHYASFIALGTEVRQ